MGIQFPYFSGQLTLLKYPYPRDVAEPSEYDTIRVHAEWGGRPSASSNQDDENKAPESVIPCIFKAIKFL